MYSNGLNSHKARRKVNAMVIARIIPTSEGNTSVFSSSVVCTVKAQDNVRRRLDAIKAIIYSELHIYGTHVRLYYIKIVETQKEVR